MPAFEAGTRIGMDFLIIIKESCNIAGPKYRKHLKKKCFYLNGRSGNQRQWTRKEKWESRTQNHLYVAKVIRHSSVNLFSRTILYLGAYGQIAMKDSG